MQPLSGLTSAQCLPANLSTSTAAMNPKPYARPMNAQAAVPTAAMPGVSGKDREMRMKNLHESGYDPKKDFTANKTMRQQ
jgi:hypothetical protein